MPKSPKYTKEYLEPIVKSSKTWTEVFKQLGIPYNGGNTRNVKAHIAHHEIDINHLQKRGKIDRDELEKAVAKSFSWQQTIENLGMKIGGASQGKVRKFVKDYDIDISHFKGQGWRNGLTLETDERIEKHARKIRKPIEEILVPNYPGSVNTKTLKRAMLKSGIEYKCQNGHDAEWMGNPLTLHIDHINGTCNDNRLENLRFLCPNCHQQTSTWGNWSN